MKKMTNEEYEFIISTVTEKDVTLAIDFFEKQNVKERDVLYFKHAIAALKFLNEILV